MFYSLSGIDKVQQYSVKKKIGYFAKSVLWYFVGIFCVGLLMVWVDGMLVKHFNASILAQIKESQKAIVTDYGFALVVIIVPIIEELIFRLVLVPNKRNVKIFISVLLLVVGYRLFFATIGFDVNFLALLAIFVVIIWIFNVRDKIGKVLFKYHKAITVLSIVIFGLMHIGNVKVQEELLFFYPIFVLPQILIGYFCSILRLRLGFIWGIFFHSLINLIGFASSFVQ